MKHCIACGKILPEKSLFSLKNAPASAQDIPDADEVKDDQGIALHLHQCTPHTCTDVTVTGYPLKK